ncbi:hypothetical protein G4X40_20165 [Rhodococcus sp. D2-41]|uniref:phage tail termination protein n=1 Tax=Speluncibacter jeojiensis TaxID=2710754 RepID=UPI0024101578|nr:hypothetical protein [Rhodococcus sp. D2-41]MDG3012458.1 hypothetical protein [Rhodococcus sp. D2-41]
MNEFPDLDPIPAWADLEALMCTYLDRFGNTCTEYPDPSVFESMLPVVLVQRAGGGSPDGIVDVAPMVVAVTATTRAQSWQVMNQVRRAVKAAEHGCVIDDQVVIEMAEQVGPQEIPQLNPDQREVQMTFHVAARLPR